MPPLPSSRPGPSEGGRFRAAVLWVTATALISTLAFVVSRATTRGAPTAQDVSPVPELHPLVPVRSSATPTLASGQEASVALAPLGPGDSPTETCVLQSPLTEAELLTVLWDGHLQWEGKPPPPQRLACAFAHCAVEHGRGKRLFGNNLGHVTTAGGWRGRSCLHSWTERAGANPDRWNVVQLQFRVHDTLLEGAIDYWKLMGSQYRAALDACDGGNAEQAGRILGELGYYTSDVESYSSAMKGLFVPARKRIRSEAGSALRP